MSERDDQSIDHELSGIAMAATYEHEQTVSPGEADAALDAVRSRLAGGDLGGVPPSISLGGASSGRRSAWVRFGAVAASISMVALGLVAVVGGGSSNDIVAPATTPQSPDLSAPVSDALDPDTPTPTMSPADPVAEAASTTVSTLDTAPTTVAADPGNGIVQPTAIVRTCAGISIECTQLALTENGRIVGFDQDEGVLRVYNALGTELQSEIGLAESLAERRPFFVAVGPDDVAYIVVDDAEPSDSGGRVVAVPLVGSNAGAVVKEWVGRARSGDSSLIARKVGLTVVPCCGGDGTRPAPDATIYRWVDRNGETIESDAPSFDLNLGRDANSLTRIDTLADGSADFTKFLLPIAYRFPRDFPRVVATDDGGALAYDFVQTRSGGVDVFVDFDTDWPGANVDNGDVYYRPIGDSSQGLLLEPTGTVLVVEGQNPGRWVRRSLDEIATQGWPGRAEVDLPSSSLDAPGLNEYIEGEQPFWATDPELFAYQLRPAAGTNAETRIEFDDTEAPTITIIATGLLDDSSEATRTVVTTERADDGLLRFVSATYGFRCVEGRGHQDFSTEPCV